MATSTNIAKHRTVVNLTKASRIIANCFKAERKGNVRMTPILWGAPGQGKTAIVDAVCAKMNRARAELRHELVQGGMSEADALKKHPMVRVQAFRLSQCDPTDLKGVPLYENVDGKEVTTFAAPKIIPIVGMPHTADGYDVLLFLDEVAQATPTMQNLASNIIDGKIGDHQIDLQRCFIVAAANRAEDLAATFQMPRNVANRIIHLHVETTFAEWEEWAIDAELHPFVIGYLKDHTSVFNEPIKEDVQVYGTPRSWHKVSAYMQAMDDEFFEDDGLSLTFLQGCVGASALPFWQFCRMAKDKYSIRKIMKGEKVDPPTGKKDILFSLAVEATMLFNTWTKEAMESPQYQRAKGANDQTQAYIKALGKDKIDAINNSYIWFDQGIDAGIDPAFLVLLNKYQNEQTRNILRSSMMLDDAFKPSTKAYGNIHKALRVNR